MERYHRNVKVTTDLSWNEYCASSLQVVMAIYPTLETGQPDTETPATNYTTIIVYYVYKRAHLYWQKNSKFSLFLKSPVLEGLRQSYRSDTGTLLA